ncbi:membrane protein [Bacteroidales bacterium]|nr:membrane protein [Bacteroidales bacterium]
MQGIKISLLLFLISFSFIAFAHNDIRAIEVLENASSEYLKAGGVSAQFAIHIKDSKLIQTFEGDIKMKGDKFYLSTPDIDTWFDGKTQWAYLKQNDEVNITEPEAEELQMINPINILGIYKNGSYTCKYLGERQDAKQKSVFEVELNPKNKKGQITKIVLQLSKIDFTPTKFQVFYKNKLENIIQINKYEKGQSLSDQIFVFDKKKYPEVDVIDLR